MSICIKTGARVQFKEYPHLVVAADLHKVEGNRNIIVVNFNPSSANYWEPKDATHVVTIGSGYYHEAKGIVVIPAGQLEVIEGD